ncbi:MAG: EAL domain-containing protein [Gallionella sp.]|nr:EAL domain-containing protein [Gallionella sp.]
MKKKPVKPDPLRAEAEAKLARAPLTDTPPRPAEELLHELRVYQIELEMQNETLRQAQSVIEASRDHYVDIYDFAPIGYLTLTREATIAEVNLTGAALLGVERKKLAHRRFTHFVTPEDNDRWHQFFMRVVQHGERQGCELALKRGDGSTFHAYLDCLHMEAGNGGLSVRIALTDITGRKRAEATLRESEQRYRQIIQTSMDGFWIADNNGHFLDVNAAYSQMIGYTRDELVNMHVTDVEAKESPEETAQHIREVMAKGYARFETRHRRKDGQLLDIEVSTVYPPDPGGGHFFAFLRDITGRKLVEEELRIAAIAFESQEGMIVTDTKGVIVRVNQAFTRLTGYSAAEAVGQTPAMLSSGRHDQSFYRQMWQTLEQKNYWQGAVWNRRKNGKIYAEWLTISAVTAPDGSITHYVGTFSDITKDSEAEAEIHRMAYYDTLTHLPNRRLLMDRLGQALATSRRSGRYGALLFLDLDNFKTLNDTRGHDVGDLLLIEIAHRLNASVREGDTVGRLGGDEFVLMLEDLSEDVREAAIQAGMVGVKVREAIALPYMLKDIEFTCTTSIGVSLFCNHDESADDLLKHADIAMYHAKKGGRNSVRFFDPDMQAALVERSALESDLRRALERRQLHLYYQIQVNSARRAIGAEALLRWEHPERGLISPARFIPLAEESGLIVPIGLWVLQTACAQIRDWSGHPATRDLQLAINVSARQFRQPDFVEQVLQAFSATGINPAHLKIELTESLVLDNVGDTITKMHALKALGISFSMDDFGTGYSSLSYLKRLPLYQLKIDQSFVRDVLTDPNDAAIARIIISLAKSMNLAVIAEGVETEAQRKFLELNDCHTFQGYLFSKPVPVEEFEQLIAKYA